METIDIHEAGQLVQDAVTAAEAATIEALRTLDAELATILDTLPDTLDTSAKRLIMEVRASFAYRIMTPAVMPVYNAPIMPTV